MSAVSFRVIKLGGSLLDSDTVTRLPAWLNRQSSATNVIIVGGGPFADLIRDCDASWRLPREVTHWLSIRAMELTAHLVCHELGGVPMVTSLDNLKKLPAGFCLFTVDDFLRTTDRQCASPLPHGWNVTSDSIAARVAAVIAARELVLLKSRLPSVRANWRQIADSGYVDDFFPEAVTPLDIVRCVNARRPDWPEIVLSRRDQSAR